MPLNRCINYLFVFVQYTPYPRMFQIKFVDINQNHTKMMFGDFNAKLGKEYIFKHTNEYENIHKIRMIINGVKGG